MFYERGSGELWHYDENGNYVESYFSRSGLRHGCILGAFLYCLAIYNVYGMRQALLGPDGALYAYSDDVYIISDHVGMVKAVAAAPGIYGKVGLMINWGHGKTYLILPHDCDPSAFLIHLVIFSF